MTVVNLTDAPIQAKIANAGNIHSGINGILPNTYYHHNALSGTGYDVSVNWYVPGVTEDYPSSDLTRLAWYVAGAFITLVGIVVAAATLGSASPALGLYVSAFWSGSLSFGAAAPVIATALGGLGPTLFLGAGALVTLVGPFAAVGGALHKTIRGWKETTFPYTIWGQSNDFLVVAGKIPPEAGLG